MKTIYFEYWGGLVEVKTSARIPRNGRYLCTDFDAGFDYYDVDEEYIVAVAI